MEPRMLGMRLAGSPHVQDTQELEECTEMLGLQKTDPRHSIVLTVVRTDSELLNHMHRPAPTAILWPSGLLCHRLPLTLQPH